MSRLSYGRVDCWLSESLVVLLMMLMMLRLMLLCLLLSMWLSLWLLLVGSTDPVGVEMYSLQKGCWRIARLLERLTA